MRGEEEKQNARGEKLKCEEENEGLPGRKKATRSYGGNYTVTE